MKNYLKHHERRKDDLRKANQKYTIALRVLREVGLVENKCKRSTRADNERKQQWHKRRLAEDPLYRDRVNSKAVKSYWKNREKCRERARTRSKLAVAARKAIIELGIEI